MNGIETNNAFIPPSSVYIHLSLTFQDPLYRVFESRFPAGYSIFSRMIPEISDQK